MGNNIKGLLFLAPLVLLLTACGSSDDGKKKSENEDTVVQDELDGVEPTEKTVDLNNDTDNNTNDNASEDPTPSDTEGTATTPDNPDATDAPEEDTDVVGAFISGFGFAPDGDEDGDGVTNDIDAFPLDSTETVDSDKDGIGNKE